MVKKIEYKLLISVFLIGAGNLAYLMLGAFGIDYIIINILVLLLFSIFLIFNGVYGNATSLSVSLFILSLVALWFTGYRDPTSIFIFLMAYHGIKESYKIVIFYILVFGLCLVAKFIYLGLDIPQLLTFMAGTSLYIILFLHFMPDNKKDNDTEVSNLPEVEGVGKEVVEIMKWRMKDLDWPDIKVKMKLNKQPSSIVSDVSRARKKSGITNQEAFTILILLGLMENKQLSEILGEEYSKYDML